MKNAKQLPTGSDLVKLAREYSDEEAEKLGSDALGYDYQLLEQKHFMEIVKWLIRKGYTKEVTP